MKQCPKCKASNYNDFMFCGKCGAPLDPPSTQTILKQCPNCKAPNYSNTMFCGKCGTSLTVSGAQPASGAQPVSRPQAAPQSAPAAQAQPGAALPMGWHKFLIFFALWAGALLNLVNGVPMLNGETYSEIKYVNPNVYESFRTAGMFYGLGMIVLAALCIVARFQLAGFKRQGPKMLLVIYAANPAITLIYAAMMSNSLGVSVGDLLQESNTAGSLVASIVMLVVNYSYYKKRESLFVN